MAKVAKTAEFQDASVHIEKEYKNEPKTDEFVKRKDALPAPPNNVLLLTVINPLYYIDVNVINAISKPLGKVLRIVIFRKNGVQAMVEYEDIASAEKAKQELDNKEIYTGSCRLKIEFAKQVKLNVYRNNSETWDFTKDAEVAVENAETSTENTEKVVKPNEVGPNSVEGTEVPLCNVPMPVYGPIAMFDPSVIPYYDDYSDYGCVIMAYNLNDQQMNPDGLFNLFCMYGNVRKIKFLKTKKGCAMVQMGDRQGAERCLTYLQGAPLYGENLQLGISKQPFLSDVGRGFELPDGSNSVKDFTNSKNNRFLTLAMANRNRLNAPSKVLHFFNMPPDLTEDRLESFVFKTAEVSLVDISVFHNITKRPSSGLMEFDSVADAVTCIVTCNNVPMHGVENSVPYFIKLCFSSAPSIAFAEQEYEKKKFQSRT